jgi:glycosyltransferase involved in cell wall biosynthesis
LRVLIDYRPALKNPSGVGEYARGLVQALTEVAAPPGERPDVTIFSSSWRDRLGAVTAGKNGLHAIDRRIPVSLLNFAWHRLEWPPAEWLARGRFDVTHSLHPLLMPATHAAQVITIHDLNFLAHPERTRSEIRRDYPFLAPAHARRADHILVPSRFTASEVERAFGVSSDRISICSPGAPEWPARSPAADGTYVLFVGTLEPRKNVGALLDAYERLADRAAADRSFELPELVLAGSATEESRPWLDRLKRGPLAGRVRHLGYVEPGARRAIYEGARLLVQPSFEEGFGLPVLEAMTVGVPVVAANRGALPEIAGGAAHLVDPGKPADIADAIARLLQDRALRQSASEQGLARARCFRWPAMAEAACAAYKMAIEHRSRCGSA